ncbi:ATP-binding protein [bacterium]|nr:ATP-binding protein [bacterium]
MQDISLHILDIIENSITAHASRINVQIVEDVKKDILQIKIDDNGKGMDTVMKHNALDPFWTLKPGKRIGLGLPLLAQASREGGGSIEIDSEPDKGTKILATFRLSHPDRKPMGDIQKTIRLMEITHPEIIFTFEHMKI